MFIKLTEANGNVTWYNTDFITRVRVERVEVTLDYIDQPYSPVYPRERAAPLLDWLETMPRFEAEARRVAREQE
jgi:hypothetical protein